MSIENNSIPAAVCPGCVRACPLDAPGCLRGEAYAAALASGVSAPDIGGSRHHGRNCEGGPGVHGPHCRGRDGISPEPGEGCHRHGHRGADPDCDHRGDGPDGLGPHGRGQHCRERGYSSVEDELRPQPDAPHCPRRPVPEEDAPGTEPFGHHCPHDAPPPPHCHNGPGPHGHGPHCRGRGPHPEPPEPEPDRDSLTGLMRRCDHYLRHRAGAPSSRERILRLLSLRGEMSQSDLVYLLGLRSASVSEQLGKLEGQGLIVRRRSDEDRRGVMISLTEAGHAAVPASPGWEAAFSALTESERLQLQALLQKLLSGWEAEKE